ncbi:hypothetical protein NPIL_373751 [Nephila pilipes]|uniref:Uncharacterized protein n=1 Tax=Nephila pilipes TaxID=299642 RepID=A0A8X6P2T8_NEPPI|nr:hypothetical protein NPIL_373751 [Nephila pilipes]
MVGILKLEGCVCPETSGRCGIIRFPLGEEASLKTFPPYDCLRSPQLRNGLSPSTTHTFLSKKDHGIHPLLNTPSKSHSKPILDAYFNDWSKPQDGNIESLEVISFWYRKISPVFDYDWTYATSGQTRMFQTANTTDGKGKAVPKVEGCATPKRSRAT